MPTKIVRLVKTGPSSKVGMTLAMYAGEADNPHNRPRVHELSADGLASQSGQLEVGDIIHRINGHLAENDAVGSVLIKDAPSEVVLEVEAKRQLDIVLKRAGGARLGVILAPGAEPGALIHQLEPGSIAATSGELAVGDVLLTINGVSVLDEEEAKLIIASSTGDVELKVLRQPGTDPVPASEATAKATSESRRPHDVRVDGEQVCVRLALSDGLRPGLTVEQKNVVGQMSWHVTAVEPGGAAEECGVVAVGDAVISIDDGDVASSLALLSGYTGTAQGSLKLQILPRIDRPTKTVTGVWA